MASVVTPERYASGMTFDEYVAYIGTPENLAREGSTLQADPSLGRLPRRDYSAYFREAFEKSKLTDDQREAFRWLVAQPGGPAKMLAISEDWSSDCRRDVPTFARIAADTGMELRIFRRDGQKYSESNSPSLAEAPDSNADIMAEFLNHKGGQTYQSIPVCVFYTRDLEYLYHYTEYPAIYDKDRVVMGNIRSARPGEAPADTRTRSDREFAELVNSAFFRIWTSAAVDEMISALHRRLVLGKV
ncbi:MAG TPA: thioredoxin family protein [Dehalococcoidia bacterium]|nr:thioredoxin family protein [Dehalococcoidia bacterium]